MEKTIIKSLPNNIGPTNLELFLAEVPELTDEKKEKVIIITDIVRLAKLMKIPPPTAQEFDIMYDMPNYLLEAKQYNAQIEWNTKQYHNQVGTPPPTWNVGL